MWLIPELYERGWEYSKYRAEEEFRKDVVINDIKYQLVVDVQAEEEFFGVYLYAYERTCLYENDICPEGRDYNCDTCKHNIYNNDIDGGTQINLMTGEITNGPIDADTETCNMKLHFQPEFYTLLTEEQQEDVRYVYVEAFEYNMPDIMDGKTIEIPAGWEVPVMQRYEVLFSFVAEAFGRDEDEAWEDARDAFSCDYHVSDHVMKQVDPTDEWLKVVGLRDNQLDILLEVLDDHRYAVIDTLKDEHMGMDEQFETRKHIDEIDKLIERLKEARA